MRVETNHLSRPVRKQGRLTIRRLGVALAIWLAGFTGAAHSADPSSEIVVAIRYLQAEGTSHSYLYLYREDGKLLRQLTKTETGQDKTPVFSPDGETIVFTREEAKGAAQYWSISPKGTGLRKLDAAPEWYTATKSSPFYTNLIPKDWPEGERLPGYPGFGDEPPAKFQAPDGSVELVLGEVKGDENNGVDGPGHGKDYLLRDLKSGKETKMGDVPGFEGLWELLHLRSDPKAFFHFDSGMRLAFFGLHLDSSAGDTSYVLDLDGPRLTRLSPNFGLPVPLPGEPAFLTYTYERYIPIPGSPKTANCSYVERWDKQLKKVRYAKEGTAPITYGVSMYRPGKKPAVVTIRQDQP